MIYSIGHSTHSWEKFSGLLKAHNINAIADVRTSPYSRHFAHFSKSEIKPLLASIGISYVFLGKELGGRPEKPSLFDGKVADYEKMASEPDYQVGLSRLISGAQKFRVAMMCAEHDPLDCHRCLMVSRSLQDREIETTHILKMGNIITQTDIEGALLGLSGAQAGDLFIGRDEQLALAYKQRTMRVAFSLERDPHKLQEAS